MIGCLQGMFIRLLSPWIPFVNRISEKWRMRLLTGCFFSILVLFAIVRYVLYRESYFLNTTLGVLIMFAIAILSLDKELKKVHWRRSVWIVWFGMCIAFTVSDILVPKKMCGLGIILAFVFTGVFFVWQNHSRRDLLWESLKRAIRYAFWAMAVLAFCFRPLYEGGRYAGIFTNPNTFGLYLFIILAVFLSDLDWDVTTGKYWYRSIPTFFSIALVIFYLSLTQARTSMVSCGAIGCMWLVFRLVRAFRIRLWRSFLKNLAFVVLFTVALYPVFKVTVTYLPDLIGHPIIFEGESLYLSDGSKIEDFGEMVIAEPDMKVESLINGYQKKNADGQTKQASESDAPEKPIVPQNVMERFWYVLENTKGLNALTNGRIDIYKGYYKLLNFKGHEYVSLMVNGSRRSHAHNNWIQFGYTYGYFGLIFYTMITILAVFFSIRFYRKRSRKDAPYAFLIPAVCVGFVVATIAECLFLPFEVFPAFLFWFSFCDLFVKRIPENRLRHPLRKAE